jgi:hypothetical protein
VLYPHAPTLGFLKGRGKQECVRGDRSKTIGQLFCKVHVRFAALDFAEIAWARLIPLRTLFAGEGEYRFRSQGHHSGRREATANGDISETHGIPLVAALPIAPLSHFREPGTCSVSREGLIECRPLSAHPTADQTYGGDDGD